MGQRPVQKLRFWHYYRRDTLDLLQHKERNPALLENLPLMETPHIRKVFYIGGCYVTDQSGNHVLKDQMYVEQLTPIGGSTKPYPLILIHGFGQTGTVSHGSLTALVSLIAEFF